MSLIRAAVVVVIAVVAVPSPGVAADEPPAPVVITDVDVTGGDDVGAAIQAAFDAVPEGGTVEFPADAILRSEQTLFLRGVRKVAINGNGATIVADSTGDRSRSHVRIQDSEDVVVRDLHVRGANPAAGTGEAAYQPDLEGQHGFNLRGVIGAELVDVSVRDTYGDLVYIGRGEDLRWSEGVWIHDSTFTRSGRQGIAVTAGRDIVIERIDISETRRATFDLEPNRPEFGAENVHILDNNVGDGRLLFLAAHGQGPVNDVVIADNRLDRPLSMSVRAHDETPRSGFWILDNRAGPAKYTPMKFDRVNDIIVRNNRSPITTSPAAVDIVDGCGLVDGNRWGDGVVPLTNPVESCPDERPRPARPTVGADLTPDPPEPGDEELAGAPPSTTEAPTTTTTDRVDAETAASPVPDSSDGGDGGSAPLVGIALVVVVGAAGLFVARRRLTTAPSS